MKNTDGLVVAGRQTLGNIDTLAKQGGELADEYKGKAAAIDQLGDAAVQMQRTLRRVELSLVGSSDKPRQRAVLDDLSAAARALERAAQNIGDQPQSLILGPTPGAPGPGETGFEAGAKK